MAHISGHAAAKYDQFVQSVDASTAFNVGADFGGQGPMPVGRKAFTELSNSDTIMVRATSQSNPRNWEVGLYTYTSSTKTLARTTILESSNSNSAVDFSAAGVAGSVRLEGLSLVASTANAYTITQIASAGRTVAANSTTANDGVKLACAIVQDLVAAGILKGSIS